tara:strand:+ start:428 stop:562 length:135 start_codon:yes stop_codon:yes gene_type:complete
MLEEYKTCGDSNVTVEIPTSSSAAEHTAAPIEFLKTTPAGVEIS